MDYIIDDNGIENTVTINEDMIIVNGIDVDEECIAMEMSKQFNDESNEMNQIISDEITENLSAKGDGVFPVDEKSMTYWAVSDSLQIVLHFCERNNAL